MEARQRMIDAVMGQFGRPRGLAGRLAGWEMTVRPSNRKRNLWAVDLLEVRPADRVLEIGFGPGVAIRALARRASAGFVYGIDHSEVMVRQATARNRAAVERNRVILRLGSAADLPTFGVVFDKVLVVNNFGMWPDPQQGLGELRSVMRPGGRVAIVSQPRQPGATPETTRRVGQATVEQLRKAAFEGMRTEVLNLRPPVVCVLAEAPGTKEPA
jgi:ubiquinone/menaquinone biosynthesis C-methylase UbiE